MNNILVTIGGETKSLEELKGLEESAEIQKGLFEKIPIYKKPIITQMRAEAIREPVVKLSRRQYIMEKYNLLNQAKSPLEKVAAIMYVSWGYFNSKNNCRLFWSEVQLYTFPY